MKNLKVTVNGQIFNVTVEENNAAAPMPTEVYESASVPEQKAAPAKAKVKVKKPSPHVNPGSYRELMKSPMPGTIMSVEVTSGQKVKKGDNLLILEAMKMENEILAPFDATVGEIKVSKGDTVDSGTELLTLI